MKVLVISAAFPPMKAPEGDHAFHLCEHLADYGLDVHVVTTKGSSLGNRPGIAVHPIMRDWSWSDLPRLAKLIRFCAADAIILVFVDWVYSHHPMITFSPTISKTLLPRVPFVTLFEDERGALPHQTSLISRVVRKVIARWAGEKDVDYEFGTLLRDSDRMIVVSDRIRDTLARRFFGVNRKSVLIPSPPIMRISPKVNGAARQRRREAIGAKPDDLLLVYFGYIYSGKGVETLLKAFRLLTLRRNRLRLLMVAGNIQLEPGKPPLYTQEMHELSRQLGIDDKITWTGDYEWDSDEASLYLRAADVCVLPFDSGACLHNSSLAGAAAHGLPIITTQGSTVEQSFVHQENVFLCPAKNPNAMAAAVETLMDKPELRQRLGIGALQLAQEWFSWEKAIERTVATLS